MTRPPALDGAGRSGAVGREKVPVSKAGRAMRSEAQRAVAHILPNRAPARVSASPSPV